MSTDILMETSMDSMESVFRDLQSRDQTLVQAGPVDKIKLKLRRQDGLVYALSGTVDKKKKLLHSAQEMIAQLTSELARKDAVVQQLKDEIGTLRTDRRGSNGKIHLLQYQLNKSKSSLDLIEADKAVRPADVQQVALPKPSKAAVIPESPLTNRQAWLMHWRNSQNYRNALVSTAPASPVAKVAATTNTSICIEAIELDRSAIVEDAIDAAPSPTKEYEVNSFQNQPNDLSCTALLSNAIAEAPSIWAGSFDLSQLEMRMREYVDSQLQMKLLNLTSASVSVSPVTPGGETVSSSSAPQRTPVISPIATNLSGEGGHISSASRRDSGGGLLLDVSGAKSFVLSTGKKSAPSSTARAVHFSYLNEEHSHTSGCDDSQSAPTSPIIDSRSSDLSSSAGSVSTTSYNEESRLSMNGRSPHEVTNNINSGDKSSQIARDVKSVGKSHKATSLMMSDDSESTLHTTLNLTEILNNKSVVSPCVIRSLFNGFLGEPSAASVAAAKTPIVVGSVSVSETRPSSVQLNRSTKSADKSIKSKANSLVTVQLTPDTTAPEVISPIVKSSARSAGDNNNKSSRYSNSSSRISTLASAVSRHSALSLMTAEGDIDESVATSPLRPTGFNFHEDHSDVIVRHFTSTAEEAQKEVGEISVIEVNEDEDEDDGSVLTCYTLNTGATSVDTSRQPSGSSNRLIIPLTAAAPAAAPLAASASGYRTPKAYRILPESPEVDKRPSSSKHSSGAKRRPLADVTNTAAVSPSVSNGPHKKTGNNSSSGSIDAKKTTTRTSKSDIERLSAKDLILGLSGGSGKAAPLAPTAALTAASRSLSYSSPVKVPSAAAAAAVLVASPEPVAATPPSKVLQFLKAQAGRMNKPPMQSVNTVKPGVASPAKPVAAAAPPPQAAPSVPSSQKVVAAPSPMKPSPSSAAKAVLPPSESLQDLHAFYQQQMQIQQQNMMQFFMQQMQQFSAASRPPVPVTATQHIAGPVEAPKETLKEVAVEVTSKSVSLPLTAVVTSDVSNRFNGGTSATASSMLSPDSFRDHMSKFKRENDKIRNDINRFKGNMEKVKDECQPYPSTRPKVVVSQVPNVVPRYSVPSSSYNSVYM